MTDLKRGKSEVPKAPPQVDPGGIPEKVLDGVVSGGVTYASPTGTFGYVRENGIRMCWPEGVFMVTDPDVIRELEYYVTKGALVKAQLNP